MKMLKKLMAVALAGVMALTVLTGCAGAVNKKDIVNTLNDLAKISGEEYTIEQGDDALARNALSKVKTYAENHNRGVYTTIEQSAMYALSSVSGDDLADIKSIVPEKAKDQYTFMWTTLDEYQSKAFKNNESMVNVVKLAYNSDVKLNDIDPDTLGKTATASIATQKIGDTTFLVIVLVQAAK